MYILVDLLASDPTFLFLGLWYALHITLYLDCSLQITIMVVYQVEKMLYSF